MPERPASAHDLATRIDQLATLVAAQQTEIDRLRGAAGNAATAEADHRPGPPDARHDRRGFLRLAGAATVGAAAAGVATTAAPAGAATVGDQTVTGKLTVTGATTQTKAAELGNGYGAFTAFAREGAVELGSKDGRPLRVQAQTRWESDDDGIAGTHLDINRPAVVLRQTGENHKGAMVEFQQQLNAGTHRMGVATNTPDAVFDVPVAGAKRVGWITAHYNSPNPGDGIHQHLNFETCKGDLKTLITRFQISWGEDVALCSFPNSNVRLVQSNKTLSFGSRNEVRAVYGPSGRLTFSGDPVSFAPGQLQVDGAGVRPVLFARKTANETLRSSTALQNDDDLAVAVQANAVYTFTLFLNWSSDRSADFKVDWTVPDGTTILWSPDAFGTAAATTTASPKQSVERDTAVTLGGVGAGTRLAMAATGIVRTAGAGTLRLRWAQNAANALPTTVYQDSFVQLMRMA